MDKYEIERLLYLQQLEILDTEPEEFLDNVTKLASTIFETEIALVSLVDEERQWFKSKVGLDASETPREYAFCAHAIKNDELFIIHNSLEDERFKDNPLATGAPHVIFYAGAPLKINETHNIGTLCIIDDKPRVLTETQKKQLRLLSDQVVHYIEMRYEATIQKKVSSMLRTLHYINSQDNENLDEVINEYLQAGVNLFDLDIGIQSRIINGEYMVEAATSPDDSIKAGTKFNIEQTFCQMVVEEEVTITFNEMSKEKKAIGHPAYQEFKLESYISTPIWFNEEIYGTLNFSSLVKRKTKFTTGEKKFVEIMADMISRKLRLREKNEQISYMMDIINESPEYVVMADPEATKVIYANKAFSNVSGIFANDKYTFADFHPKKTITMIQEDALPMVQNNELWRSESTFIDKDGNSVPVLQTIMGHSNPLGEVMFITNIMQDISKQKEIQENLVLAKDNAEKASKMKTDFLANISHEIRTPMNGIVGLISLLRESHLNKNQLNIVHNIETCGDGLLTLLNDVLDLSKIEAGKLDIESIDFYLAPTVDQAVSLFSFRAEEKNISLIQEIDDEIPEVLVGDPIRIKQIIINFVSNALKFTEKGSVFVKTSFKKLSENKIELSIAVKDTGVGIDKDNTEKIFSDFQQEDTSTTRNYGGTGLGLSISMKLAKIMGGDIELQSTKGKGSVFTLKLPLIVSNEAKFEETIKNGIKSRHDISETATTYPHEVLVVEDNMINQKLAKNFLRKLGYKPDFANNGKIAVEMTEKKQYSLIFMDMQMPIMDGVEATELILGAEKVNPPIIVAMTANVFKEDKERCHEAGMSAFLAKPFKVDDFVSVITNLSYKS